MRSEELIIHTRSITHLNIIKYKNKNKINLKFKNVKLNVILSKKVLYYYCYLDYLVCQKKEWIQLLNFKNFIYKLIWHINNSSEYIKYELLTRLN